MAYLREVVRYGVSGLPAGSSKVRGQWLTCGKWFGTGSVAYLREVVRYGVSGLPAGSGKVRGQWPTCGKW